MQLWDLDFHDSRQYDLVPSLFVAPDGTYLRNTALKGMAVFQDPLNEVLDLQLTPNEITATVLVRRSGVLAINQIRPIEEGVWVTDEGPVDYDAPTLAVKLDARDGPYTVRLRYRPMLFYYGVAVSALVALGGVVLLLTSSRRRPAADGAARGDRDG